MFEAFIVSSWALLNSRTLWTCGEGKGGTVKPCGTAHGTMRQVTFRDERCFLWLNTTKHHQSQHIVFVYLSPFLGTGKLKGFHTSALKTWSISNFTNFITQPPPTCDIRPFLLFFFPVMVTFWISLQVGENKTI